MKAEEKFGLMFGAFLFAFLVVLWGIESLKISNANVFTVCFSAIAGFAAAYYVKKRVEAVPSSKNEIE